MADTAAAVGATGAVAEERPPALSGPATVTTDETGPVIVTADETGLERPGVDTARWAALAAAVLCDEHVTGGELGLLFVDAAEMAKLNREHMGGDGPTDVLAFPLDGADPAAAAAGGGPLPGDAAAVAAVPGVRPAAAAGAGPLLGDVVVCPARATAQSADHAGAGHDGSLEDELALLVVHGVLHVLGYDHSDDADAAAMQAREQQMLAAHHCRP